MARSRTFKVGARSIAIIGVFELRPRREPIAGPSPADAPERLPCAGRRESHRRPRAERVPDGSPSRRTELNCAQVALFAMTIPIEATPLPWKNRSWQRLRSGLGSGEALRVRPVDILGERCPAPPRNEALIPHVKAAATGRRRSPAARPAAVQCWIKLERVGLSTWRRSTSPASTTR